MCVNIVGLFGTAAIGIQRKLMSFIHLPSRNHH